MPFDNHFKLSQFLCILSLALGGVTQYTAVPRWGQAVSLVNNVLFIHGGKTDPYNSYSYSSAPTSNDLLYLPLSDPFDASSPPWQLISSSTNSTTPQGPTLAWHTLSAFNTSAFLVLGGDPGPNSATVILDRTDSAVLLSIFDGLSPVWVSEVQSWANEPIRRIHHSASSAGGKIWLVGGEKDDGSNNALSDHYVFDPSVPSFTQLPSANGPPDLYGHASVVLPNGLMIVFGGYCQSMGILIPFTTVWAIDTTQSSLTWITLPISNLSVPEPRRAFAIVLLDDGNIFIQGGADAVLQTVYGDGWVLDTTQSPMAWTAVNVLSQLGPRYDHFSVAVGSQILFGCGYGLSGAADSTLHIYDPSGSSFVPSFTPASVSPFATLPVPSQTQTYAGPFSSGVSHYGSGTSAGGIWGTGTKTGSVQPTYTQGGSNPNAGNNSRKNVHTAAIAVGTTFGILALVAGSLITGYYVKRNRDYLPTRFHLLGNETSEDGDGAHAAAIISTTGVQQEKISIRRSGWFSGSNKEISNQTGVGLALHDTGLQRRDMFADEDTREFAAGSVYGVGEDGTGGSSWSLQSMGAAIGSIGAGVRVILSRQNSKDVHSPHASDPFLGGDAAAVAPHDRRQTSYASTLLSYHDPFADHAMDEAAGSDDVEADKSTRLTVTDSIPSRTKPSLGLHTFAPLSPLIEQVSRTSNQTSLSSSRATPSDHVDSNASLTSYDYKLQRHSSIINAPPVPNTPIRRSDSWWARFTQTSFLDWRSSEVSSKALDIRDPNPPPRLVTIREVSTQSSAPDMPESQVPGHNAHEHRKSASSLQTALTADSDAIERMGGMDVIQRVGTHGSHQTAPSTGDDSLVHDPSWTPRPLSIVVSSGSEGSHLLVGDARTVESPVDMTSILSQKSSALAPPPQAPSTPQRPITSGGKVLSRVQAYERKISQDAEGVPTPVSPNVRNTRKREEHPSKNRVTINYGLAPKPSLFVANPDHKGTSSSES